jgi:diacylglycerol kinase family enzyme
VIPGPGVTRGFSRVLVVANPTAGLRRGRDAGADVARAVEARGVEVALERTTGRGDARRLGASAASSGFDLVLAVGGDGTVHEVANGAAGTSVAVGVAPSGTMNLLARILALPLDPVRAAERIVSSPRMLRLRPGRAGETLFLLMAGIGLDAWVLRRLLDRGPGKVTFRDYVVGTLSGLLSYPLPEIVLEVPGGTIRCTSAVVGRAPLYGGFLRPTPNASLEKDALEVSAFDLPTRAAYLPLLTALWSGSHAGRPGVTNRLVGEVRATSSAADVPVQVDGEPLSLLPMDFGLSPRLLTLAH